MLRSAQGCEQHVSDGAHILIFSLDRLNKDEAISKLIFGISIFGQHDHTTMLNSYR